MVTRSREQLLHRLDWTFPARPVDREVVRRLPPDAADRDADSHPPLLFVHGHSHGAWCWAHWQRAAAAAGWPTYAVSLRGHGGSTGAEYLQRTTIRHYVHDVMQAITELPEPPVLIGHSMGGLVVQHVLERYPARAGVLVAPVPGDHGLAVFWRLLRSRPIEALRALALQPVRFDRGLLFAQLDAGAAARHEARLGPESAIAQLQLVLPKRRRRSKAPVLVIGGGEDALIPVADLCRTARHYGTRPRMFAGLGHDLMLEADWKWPLQVVLDWLSDTLAERERPAGG